MYKCIYIFLVRVDSTMCAKEEEIYLHLYILPYKCKDVKTKIHINVNTNKWQNAKMYLQLNVFTFIWIDVLLELGRSSYI